MESFSNCEKVNQKWKISCNEKKFLQHEGLAYRKIPQKPKV